MWEILGLIGVLLWMATFLAGLLTLAFLGINWAVGGSGPWVRFRRWLLLRRMVRAYQRASRQQQGNSGTFLP